MDKYLINKDYKFYSTNTKFYDVIKQQFIDVDKKYKENGFDNVNESITCINNVKIDGVKDKTNDFFICKFVIENYMTKVESIQKNS